MERHASRDSRPTIEASWACQRRISAGLMRSMGWSLNQGRTGRLRPSSAGSTSEGPEPAYRRRRTDVALPLKHA